MVQNNGTTESQCFIHCLKYGGLCNQTSACYGYQTSGGCIYVCYVWLTSVSEAVESISEDQETYYLGTYC